MSVIIYFYTYLTPFLHLHGKEMEFYWIQKTTPSEVKHIFYRCISCTVWCHKIKLSEVRDSQLNYQTLLILVDLFVMPRAIWHHEPIFFLRTWNNSFCDSIYSCSLTSTHFTCFISAQAYTTAIQIFPMKYHGIYDRTWVKFWNKLVRSIYSYGCYKWHPTHSGIYLKYLSIYI